LRYAIYPIYHIPDYQLRAAPLFPAGQANPTGKNRSINWMVEVASLQEYEEYETHLAHIAYIENGVKSAVVPETRAAIHFKVVDT
jgi:hypothetical protein